MSTTDFTKEFLVHHDNHIWFYSDIDSDTCLHLNALLGKLDRELSKDEQSTIHLHISSYGGSVIAALSTIDTIRSLKSKVHTYVDGGAASAATLISCVGARRFIGKYSFMLIHQVRSANSGKLQELEDDIKNTRQFMDIIKDIYKKHTKLSAKKMDELLKSDLWLSADVCLEYGLVDKVL